MTAEPPPTRQTRSPSSTLEEFAVRARTAARTWRIDAETVEILDACAAVGVEPLVLKGAALARTLYRSDESRGYFDIDLLVAPDDLPVVGRVLGDRGYRNVGELLGIDDIGGYLHADMWSRFVPEFGNLTVDVHRRLDGCEAPADVVWRALSARAASIAVGGGRVRALNRPGLALHLALHVAQHGPDDLKAIADLKRGLERWPVAIWRSAARLAGELRATEAFAAGLSLVSPGDELARRLDLPSPDARLRDIAHRSKRPRGTFHLRAFADARSLSERIDVIRRSLLPKRAWIVHEHRWAAMSRHRLIAAYCLHILRAPVWAWRAWQFRRRGYPGG
jgi:hypothetical protein